MARSSQELPAFHSPTNSPGSARLVIQAGARNGQTVPIDQRRLVIGREAGVDLKLPDFLCSRQHAEIVCDEGNLWIVDLRSRNGTFVNATRIQGVTLLRDGDRISVGGTTLVLQCESSIRLAALPDQDRTEISTRSETKLLTAHRQHESADVR